MKLNNKGFTMIELIAVVAILGILALIAVPSVAPYVNKSRKTSLNTMLKSTYEAAENYMIKNEIVLNDSKDLSIDVKELVEDDYLQPLIDPIGDNQDCYSSGESKVLITRIKDSMGGLPNYLYQVTIVCPNSGTKIYTYGDSDLESVYSETKRFYANENITSSTYFLRHMILKGYLTDLESKLNEDGCLETTRSSFIKRENFENKYKYTINLTCSAGDRKGVFFE